MKKIILPALATVAVLGLGACSASDDTPEGAATDTAESAMTAETGGADASTTTGTTTNGTVTTGTGTDTGATVDTNSADSVTISEDGVNASINDGDTSVDANVDGDPSVTVTNR
ncbi:MAG TPA: hypothetical protein VHN58_11985 [Croceicoccus sp.]|nr:hypothetical protein [Croceicoccus sp.]